MKMNFKILILGSDANAYYMARCYYEAYHKKAHLIGKEKLAFTKFSNILTVEYNPNLWNEEEFIKVINNYAKSFITDLILLVSTNETYSKMIAKNKDKLSDNLIFPKQNVEVLETLVNKELFYKTYQNSCLTFPKTYFYNINDDFFPILDFPVILKPADVISYNHLNFKDKHKIYKIESLEELTNVVNKIKNSGYKDKIILQEYILGDDSHLYDSVVYVNHLHQVKVISFAQIGLQEHSLSMVGNAATLINGYSTFRDAPINQMKEAIVKFMESIDYVGFAEIDMKYDEKSKTFKVLEINARQGRSSYYISKLGANLIEVMAKDLINKEELPLLDLDDEVLLSFVPKCIIKKYIKNNDFKKKVLAMWKKRVSPMECNLDTNFKRFLLMKKRLWHYRKDYKNAYWKY